MTGRIYQLTEIHQRIDERLRLARKRRMPDWLEVARLKKMKLRVKDLIHQLLPKQPLRG